MAFNELNPAKAERLALLLEELGEAQQAIGKILRHGYDSFNPYKRDAGTNRQMLERELGDVESAIRRLVHAGDLRGDAIEAASRLKDESVKPYLHHQDQRADHGQQ